MKFYTTMTADIFLRKEIRRMLNREKDRLEFGFKNCEVLIIENRGFFESHFRFECKGLPDDMESNVRKWMNDMKKIEQ
jgi:hypothetical protein